MESSNFSRPLSFSISELSPPLRLGPIYCKAENTVHCLLHLSFSAGLDLREPRQLDQCTTLHFCQPPFSFQPLSASYLFYISSTEHQLLNAADCGSKLNSYITAAVFCLGSALWTYGCWVTHSMVPHLALVVVLIKWLHNDWYLDMKDTYIHMHIDAIYWQKE